MLQEPGQGPGTEGRLINFAFRLCGVGLMTVSPLAISADVICIFYR